MSRYKLARRLTRASALLLAISATAYAQSSTGLSCQQGNSGTDVVQLCTGSGTLAAGSEDKYTFSIASDPVMTIYEGIDVDIEVRLSSVTGNVDLGVTQPSGYSFKSTRNVGEDIVFINKREVASGTYTIVVKGKALTTNYILMVYITNERELNPVEEVVMGQFLLECCNREPNSCTALKQAYPSLADNDNSTNPNFCYIHGNVCTREGRLEELSMPGNNMACPLPAQLLKSFSKLERLDLSSNRISGNLSAVATTLSSAANLQYLDLSNNSLWGDLTQACGFAKTGFVEQISLARNNISGNIPSCILGLKNLVELRLDNNLLQGKVPTIPGAKSSKLTYFTAANQTTLGGGFNGSLPTSIGELSRLTHLDFSNNSLTGNLPNLPASIRDVNLQSNNISNSGYAEAIPASYGVLGQLRTLKLRSNVLSGFLPAEVAAIGSLVHFDVSSNALSSTLPAEWGGSTNLALLKLDHNSLTGTIPGTLADLKTLIQLDLSNNQFSGTVDEFAEELIESRAQGSNGLRFFSAAKNDLSGPLTDVHGLSKLGMFSSAAVLSAQSGLPGSQTNLTLDLSGNGFSGAWPTWLFDALRSAPSRVEVNLSGSTLTCPSSGWTVRKAVPAGYLDGLTCQTTSSSGAIQQVPLNEAVAVEQPSKGISGGAVFGIIIAILIALSAAGYIIWFWRKRTEQQRAAAAAAFGSGFSGYPPQGRGTGFATFSDDHAAWADPASGGTTPGHPGTPSNNNKTKQVGLASLPLSQRGEF